MSVADDPYKYFRIEAREIVDDLNRGLLDLERGVGGVEVVKRLLRGAHTLKGAARVVKLTEIAEITHAVEDALAPFRDSASGVPRDRVDAILRLVDDIAARLPPRPPTTTANATHATHAIHATHATHASNVSTHGHARHTPTSPAAESARPLVSADELDDVVEGAAEVHSQLVALRRSLADVARIKRTAASLLANLHAELRTEERTERGQTSAQRAIVNGEELFEMLARLERATSMGTEQLDAEVRQLRAAAERVRLVPMQVMFGVLERSSRDAARSVGKRVAFQTTGGDIRVEPSVLTLLQSALLQVVKNAVTHGIEDAAERAAAGKARDGRVSLAVRSAGSRVVLSCSDDGRGVDVDAIRRAASARNGTSVPAGTAVPGTAVPGGAAIDDDVMKILFEGGISTAPGVSALAGRGIGLDVVRDVVARLNGKVAVRTERGRGTTIEVDVPLSLSALETLVVEAGAERVSVPVSAVRATLRISDSDIARSGDGDSISFNGSVIPFAPLVRALAPATQGARARAAACSAIVVDAGGALAAVGVDRLVGTATILLRALPAMAPADDIVAGASLDADGHPQLVLDPSVLVARVRSIKPIVERAQTRAAPILIVDDSLTTRMLEQSILESAGFDVDLATSGEEAIRKAADRAYSLFLVDVEMPGMTGFDFVALLRADPRLRALPAILVTSRASPQDRQRGVDVGANAYVVKSEFDQKALLALIRSLIRDVRGDTQALTPANAEAT